MLRARKTQVVAHSTADRRGREPARGSRPDAIGEGERDDHNDTWPRVGEGAGQPIRCPAPALQVLRGDAAEGLEEAAARHAPLAIVQSRAKAVSSFAEKTLRKRKPGHGYDPVRQFTDLCGARVITHCRSEVNLVGRFIESHFDVDWENSVDATQRLRPTEFGYRSVHYIVSFRRGVFPGDEIDVTVGDDLYPDTEAPMKAEIQVRTVLEHAWADLSHELTYKKSFRVPSPWLREIARVAALLEDVDGAFERLHEGPAALRLQLRRLPRPGRPGAGDLAAPERARARPRER